MEQSRKLLQDLLDHEKQLDAKLADQQTSQEKLQKEVDIHEAEIKKLKERLNQIDQEFQVAENDSDAGPQDKEYSRKVQEMLALYEKLKADEKKFKECCQSELERLQALDAQADSLESPGAELQAQLAKSKAKVEAGRIELASISRNLSNVKREIDQVPSRAELREYRLRFTELYNQVSATHRQTKQYYSLYNSLADTKMYMEKELSLLNSIADSYHMASTTAAGREDYLRQLNGIFEGIKDSSNKVDKQLQIEKVGVAKQQQEMQTLVEAKVAYEKCLVDLEVQCRENDQLLAQCKIQGQQKR